MKLPSSSSAAPLVLLALCCLATMMPPASARLVRQAAGDDTTPAVEPLVTVLPLDAPLLAAPGEAAAAATQDVVAAAAGGLPGPVVAPKLSAPITCRTYQEMQPDNKVGAEGYAYVDKAVTSQNPNGFGLTIWSNACMRAGLAQVGGRCQVSCWGPQGSAPHKKMLLTGSKALTVAANYPITNLVSSYPMTCDVWVVDQMGDTEWCYVKAIPTCCGH